MRKKLIATFFLAGLLGAVIPSVDTDAAWKRDANGRYYTVETSPGYLVGWKKIGKYRYYFNEDKYAATGWKYIEKDWYYFDARGRMLKGVWVDGSYLGANGKMVKSTVVNGVQIDENGNRVGTPSENDPVCGTPDAPRNTWISRNGLWYYYNYQGKLATGLLTIKENTYYLDPQTGARMGGVINLGGDYYYFDPQTGVRKTGYIVLSDGTGYYFDKKTGAALKGWQKISRKYYFFDNTGVLQRNCWIDKTYYVDQLGRRCYGWIEVKGKKYYLNSKTGKKTTGQVKIDNATYRFKSNGVLVTNRWFKNRYYQADGRMAVRTWVNNQYVNASGKVIRTESPGFFTRKKKTYYIRQDLTMAKNGWEQIGNAWYYFKAKGALLKNSWKDGYYVNDKGIRIVDQFRTIDKQTYFFQMDGTVAKGLLERNGNHYYMDPETGVLRTGFQLLDGVNYYFDPKTGIMVKDTVMTINDAIYSFDQNGAATLDAEHYELGRAIAQYAQQFIGYPYSYGGGTDLTKGVDCSGFTMLVYAHFGIPIPRTSQAQAKGTSAQGGPYAEVKYVSEKEMMPGDIIAYYGSVPSHVAIYIGNGKVVHASNSLPYPAGGIKISDYDLGNPKNITKIMRYW